MNVLQPKIAGAQGHGVRLASGDKSGLDAGDAGDRNAGPILSMEAFGFNHDLSGGLGARWAGCRNGKQKKLALGEDTVYIEEKELDFFSAGFGGFRFGHCGDSSIAESGSSNPEHLNPPAKLFKVAVRGHQDSLVQNRQPRRNAIDIGNLVASLDFAGLQRLRKVHRN